jgi:hypothetical protein
VITRAHQLIEFRDIEPLADESLFSLQLWHYDFGTVSATSRDCSSTLLGGRVVAHPATPDRHNRRARALIIDNAAFAIRADRVSFRYRGRSSAPVLTDVSVALDQRPTVLIGPNGAGKSTLLRLLTGQLRPTTGTASQTGRIGWSPQHTPALPGFTVGEQVRYATWLAGGPRRRRSAGGNSCAGPKRSDRADRSAGDQAQRR